MNKFKQLYDTLMEGAEEDLISFNNKLTLAKAKKDGVQISEIRGNTYMTVYHGTSPANWKKIMKSNKFKSGSFFASDLETAQRYSRTKISRGEGVVITAMILADVLTPSTEYWYSDKDVFYGSGVYLPKGVKY